MTVSCSYCNHAHVYAGNRVNRLEHEYDHGYEQKGKRRALRPAPPLSLSSFSLAIAL